MSVASMFEFKLGRGDLAGAIDMALLEADDAKRIAQEALQRLEEDQAEIDRMAEETLRKYGLA